MFLPHSKRHGPSDVILVTKTGASEIRYTKSHISCLFLPVIGECRIKKCREKDVVYGCSNIADLNIGVSLRSSPEHVLKESARYFVGDFAICFNHFISALLWASNVDAWI